MTSFSNVYKFTKFPQISTTKFFPCTNLLSSINVRGTFSHRRQVASSRRYRASFSMPRTYYAALRMYGVTEIASYRRISSCINWRCKWYKKGCNVTTFWAVWSIFSKAVSSWRVELTFNYLMGCKSLTINMVVAVCPESPRRWGIYRKPCRSYMDTASENCGNDSIYRCL